MDRDAADNLFVAANAPGSIWKITPNAEMCVLLRGLPPFPDGPSAVAVGVHGSAFPPENLYVVAFNGDVTEIEGVAEPGHPAEAEAPGRAAGDRRRPADALHGHGHGERPPGRGRTGAARRPGGAHGPAWAREADAEVQAPGQAARDGVEGPATGAGRKSIRVAEG